MPIATGLIFQLASNPPHCSRKLPFLKGSSVAQGTGLAAENRDIVQRIIDGFATSKGTDMFADNLSILPALNPASIGPDLNGSSDGTCINGIAVVVEAN